MSYFSGKKRDLPNSMYTPSIDYDVEKFIVAILKELLEFTNGVAYDKATGKQLEIAILRELLEVAHGKVYDKATGKQLEIAILRELLGTVSASSYKKIISDFSNKEFKLWHKSIEGY